jgi:hypothetical protein
LLSLQFFRRPIGLCFAKTEVSKRPMNRTNRFGLTERPPLVPITPAVGVPAPAPQGATGPSSPRRRRRSNQRSRRVRTERRRAARAVARHDAPLDATTPAEGFPHRICNATTAYTSSVGTDIAAYDDLPGYHLLAARRLIATEVKSYHGSDSELPPATLHGYAEWDFSGVQDPVSGVSSMPRTTGSLLRHLQYRRLRTRT